MIMELDELKQTWNQISIRNNIKTDIMKLIQQESRGPVAAMKRVFKKQMTVMALIPLLLIATNLNGLHIIFSSIMFWCYVIFCISIVVFSYYNYRIVRKMENMDEMVRSNLEQQINLLERRKKLELIGMRSVLLFFIVMAEAVPYIQHYRMLDLWHSFSAVARFSAYSVLLILQYFINRRISERNVGIHLTHLKELLSDLN
jgi:hypothetical protein